MLRCRKVKRCLENREHQKSDFCPTVTPHKSPELGPGASRLGQDEIDEILRVLVSGSLSRDYGPDRQDTVLRFEARFAHRMQVEHALGVTSGTAALRVALVAGGVGPGDEVIVPSCTHVSTAGAAVLLGAVPVFAEIDDPQPWLDFVASDKYVVRRKSSGHVGKNEFFFLEEVPLYV